jgi:hypothetical protein
MFRRGSSGTKVRLSGGFVDHKFSSAWSTLDVLPAAPKADLCDPSRDRKTSIEFASRSLNFEKRPGHELLQVPPLRYSQLAQNAIDGVAVAPEQLLKRDEIAALARDEENRVRVGPIGASR